MNNIIKPFVLVIVYSLPFPSQVFAWTLNIDFEDGLVGDLAQGKGALSEAFSHTKYTNAVRNTGNLAAELMIDKGSEGWGSWGGEIKFPIALHQGDEIWFRTYIYFPSDFDFSATGIGLKMMRIHTSKDKTNEGYVDVLVARSNGLTISGEIDPLFFENNGVQTWKGIADVVPRGTWQAYEQYVKFSSVPGDGIYRVWQNGKLVFEDAVTRTLRSPTSKSDWIYIFGYWNGNAPKTQKAYMDSTVVTSEHPGNTDAHGNPFIGLVNKP